MGTSWTVQDMTWKGSTCSAHAFCNQSTSQGLNRGRLACAGYKNLHPHPECLSSWLESIKSSKKQANQPRTALLEVNHSVLQPLLTVDYGNFVPCETHLKLATVGQASSAAHLQWYFPAVPPPTPVGAGSHRNHVAVARHPRAASWSQCPCDAHICGWGEWPGRYLRHCKLDASCMRFHRFSWFMVFQPKWNIIIQPAWLHYFPSFPVKNGMVFWSPSTTTFWGFGLINAKNCGKSTFKKAMVFFGSGKLSYWVGTQINRQLHTTSNPWIHLDTCFSVSREPNLRAVQHVEQVIRWWPGGTRHNATSCNLNIFSSTCRRYVYPHISLFLKYVEFKDHACGM